MAINGKGRPSKEQTLERQKINRFNEAISAYEREFKSWESRVTKILERYRDDRTAGTNKQARFNILWSNVQTLVPATFSRIPQPDVSRRFRDNDQVGRVASLILERALDFEVQHYPDYRATLNQSVHDRFLGGRGTAWARYEPHIRAKQQGLPEDGAQVSEDVDSPEEELDYECAPTDYVHWRDFGHSIARTWEEVGQVWRKVYMTRDQCVERFGDEEGKKIPLDTSPETDKRDAQSESGDYQRALVYEIWNKPKKTATWFSKSLGKILDEKNDPLQLEGFFPCPRPLYATLTNDSLKPVPDFTLYQDQARELDTLCDRIDGLVTALQVKGVYDVSVPELGRVFTEGSNTSLIPVKNWQAFAEKQGLAGAIDLIDLTPIASALKEAYLAMDQITNQVYQITGISDIIRGQTAANETATAQQLKGQYASLRLKAFQEQVAQYATDILRLKAQIICGKFDPDTILKISGADQLSEADKELIPQAMELLLGERATNPDADMQNPLRSFRIDIAADTLVQMDEQAEQQARTEFLNAVGSYLQKALPVVQASPDAGGLVLDLLKFGVTGYKVGKQIEGTIDQAIEKMKMAAQQPKQPPPDPAMEKVKAQAAADQARLQADQQENQQRMQMESQSEQIRANIEMNMERQRLTMEAQFEQQRMAMEQQRDAQAAAMDMQFQQFKALLEAQTKIQVAEIGADATLSAEQSRAADEGSRA